MQIDEATLKKALTAFKKRLKVTQLDDESRLGRSPLSSSKDKIVAIQPPRDFPMDVWRKLVDLGVLKDDGGGLFMLTGKQLSPPSAG